MQSIYVQIVKEHMSFLTKKRDCGNCAQFVNSIGLALNGYGSRDFGFAARCLSGDIMYLAKNSLMSKLELSSLFRLPRAYCEFSSHFLYPFVAPYN